MRSVLVLGIAALSFTTASGQEASFRDDFEAAQLDPFWTAHADGGSITFPSTAQYHGGSQCVQFDSVDGAHKSIGIGHAFDEDTYGVVSVFLYDTGADVESSNYMILSASPFSVYTTDYDGGPGAGGNYQVQVQPNDPIDSGVDRTVGWHEFRIRSTPSSSTVWIDGVTVYTGDGGQPFTETSIAMFGPEYRPAFVSYFDDFSLSTSLASWGIYGDGFSGTDGVPQLAASADPILGSTLRLDVENSSDDYTVALMLIGTEATSLPTTRGGTLLVVPSISTLLALSPYGNSIAADLPADELLSGLEIFAQVLELDAGAARGVSFTPGLKLTLGH